jgi:hypothetical protein
MSKGFVVKRSETNKFFHKVNELVSGIAKVRSVIKKESRHWIESVLQLKLENEDTGVSER